MSLELPFCPLIHRVCKGEPAKLGGSCPDMLLKDRRSTVKLGKLEKMSGRGPEMVQLMAEKERRFEESFKLAGKGNGEKGLSSRETVSKEFIPAKKSDGIEVKPLPLTSTLWSEASPERFGRAPTRPFSITSNTVKSVRFPMSRGSVPVIPLFPIWILVTRPFAHSTSLQTHGSGPFQLIDDVAGILILFFRFSITSASVDWERTAATANAATRTTNPRKSSDFEPIPEKPRVDFSNNSLF